VMAISALSGDNCRELMHRSAKYIDTILNHQDQKNKADKDEGLVDDDDEEEEEVISLDDSDSDTTLPLVKCCVKFGVCVFCKNSKNAFFKTLFLDVYFIVCVCVPSN
jgi:hypothetical protein